MRLRIELQKLMWLGPTFLTLHNFEEILGLRELAPAERPIFGFNLIRIPITLEQFAVAMLLLTLLAFGSTYAGVKSQRHQIGIYLFLFAQSVIFFNALRHAMTGLLSLSYNPGMITAILLNIPFSIVIYRRLLREGYTKLENFFSTVLLALVLYSLIAGLFLLFGQLVMDALR